MIAPPQQADIEGEIMMINAGLVNNEFPFNGVSNTHESLRPNNEYNFNPIDQFDDENEQKIYPIQVSFQKSTTSLNSSDQRLTSSEERRCACHR
jgi:hypothetical protein